MVLMGGKSKRSGGNPGSGDRVRTHLLFGQKSEHHTIKRKRRTHNRLMQNMHKKDEMVQAGPDEIDPSLWTGNQRVLHFGPMAQRDPFFYYYPKGWDVLYPAKFGFFPYRTNKFRGSSYVVCLWSFGIFFLIGSLIMIYLGYFVMHDSPFWTWPPEKVQFLPPIQIAGPILFIISCLLIVIGIIASLLTSTFLNEKLRHYYHKNQPANTTVLIKHFPQSNGIYERNPYQPLPPPAYPVLENRYARSSFLNARSELKLYPPVMPGYSTLFLHGKQNTPFLASPYTTLRAISLTRFGVGSEETSQSNTSNIKTPLSQRKRSNISQETQKRSKSIGPSFRGSFSGRRIKEKEGSQF
uniref:Uncharacterized protein n=1 Tax=Strongyloides venezuelensis TaxID=75913 RepID=A0A0K0FG23_STRVS